MIASTNALRIALYLIAAAALACGDDGANQNIAAPPTPSASVSAPNGATTLEGEELLEALRQGGYNIVIRHAVTDAAHREHFAELEATIQASGDSFDDCSQQRNLSNAGREQATNLGRALEALNIPYGEVLTSPYCRARDTAELAFGEYTEIPGLTMIIDALRDEEETAAMHSLLIEQPAQGLNRILVTHIPNIQAAGLPPISEGESLILKPSGTDWQVIAQLEVEDWQALQQ